VTGPTIRFAGVDLVDGTPVIDLKPYVTRFDRPAGEPRCGWFDQVTMTDGITLGNLLRPGRPPDQADQPLPGNLSAMWCCVFLAGAPGWPLLMCCNARARACCQA
jgi:hypothetical protein